MEARKKGHSSFKLMKKKEQSTRILHPMNMYIRNKGETKNLSDEGKNIKRKPGSLEIKKEQQTWPTFGLI